MIEATVLKELLDLGLDHIHLDISSVSDLESIAWLYPLVQEYDYTFRIGKGAVDLMKRTP